MSVDLALRHLARLVESADVRDPLRWVDPDAGAVVSLAEYVEGPHAAFELVPGSVQDGGEGGCTPGRTRLTVRLRVRYRVAGSRHALGVRMMADWDAVRLVTMYAPGTWEQGTTGLALVLLGPMIFEGPLLGPGQTSPRHAVMAADFTLELDF